MWTGQRYPFFKSLLNRHAGPFLICFSSIMFILLMQFLILHADKLIGKGIPALIILELIVTNLAYMVVMAVPMAVLVATVMAFGGLSERNEWTALQAAGVHPLRVMAPMILVSLGLAVSVAWFSHAVLPQANQKARALFIDIRSKKPGFELQEGAFYEGIEGYTFLVNRIDASTDSLYDITLIQREGQGRQRATIRAQRGYLSSTGGAVITLSLRDGAVIRQLPTMTRSDSRLESSSFEQYVVHFDVSSLAFSRSQPDARALNDRTMSANQMRAEIDTLEQSSQQDWERFQAQSNAVLRSTALNVWSNWSRERAQSDSLGPIETKYVALSRFGSPETQNRALNMVKSNLDEYRTHAAALASSERATQSDIASYAVEIFKKTSIPFACVVFAWLGAPLGILVRRGNIGIAGVLSALALTLYFVLVIQGEKFADRLVFSPFWGMWAPNVLYGLFAWLALTFVIRTHIRPQFFIGWGKSRHPSNTSSTP
jgi:lipopolysaccharide export system permease protein